jgi:hypothetical protein
VPSAVLRYDVRESGPAGGPVFVLIGIADAPRDSEPGEAR